MKVKAKNNEEPLFNNFNLRSKLKKKKQLSSIKKIFTINEILENYKKGTLFVFDIDETLVSTPRCQLLSNRGKELFWEEVKKHFRRISKRIEMLNCLDNADALNDCKLEMMESSTLKVIQQLQKKHFKIMALTAREKTNRGDEEQCIYQLKQMGFDFKKNSPFPKDLALNDAIYQKGILFAGGNDKGEMLQKFLKDTRSTFKKIVFVDNLISKCKKVHTAMKRTKIPVQCFHYKPHKKRKALFERNICHIQIKHFFKTRELKLDSELYLQMN